MLRVDMDGAKRRAKKVMAVVGLGLTLTAAALPSQALAYATRGGKNTGHKVG